MTSMSSKVVFGTTVLLRRIVLLRRRPEQLLLLSQKLFFRESTLLHLALFLLSGLVKSKRLVSLDINQQDRADIPLIVLCVRPRQQGHRGCNPQTQDPVALSQHVRMRLFSWLLFR